MRRLALVEVAWETELARDYAEAVAGPESRDA